MFECDICKKRFAHRSDIATHLLTHQKVFKRYKCEICEKKFPSESNLEKHQRTHSNDRVECDQCGKTFATRQSLSVHIKLIHNYDASISEKCHICDKEFKTKTSLRQHTKLHANECSRCVLPTKRCVCPKDWGADRRILAGDNFLLKCQTCSKMILRKVQLKNHLRKHEDYICLACNEDYRNCNCSDDHMEVSKSKHTYQKIGQSSTNVSEKIKTVEPKIKVKKEDNFTLVSDNNSIKLSGIVVPKEEPKEEYLEIGESSVESFTHITAKVDEAEMTINIKHEKIEL